MGTLRYTVEVGDPQGQRFERLEALVDTGASYTTVPASLLHSLGVEPFDRVPFIVADGRTIERDVGQTWVRPGARSSPSWSSAKKALPLSLAPIP